MGKEKKDEEDDGLQHTCEECGAVYEDTASIRRIIAKLNGRFVCPDCLAESKAAEKKAEKAEKAEKKAAKKAEKKEEKKEEKK